MASAKAEVKWLIALTGASARRQERARPPRPVRSSKPSYPSFVGHPRAVIESSASGARPPRPLLGDPPRTGSHRRGNADCRRVRPVRHPARRRDRRRRRKGPPRQGARGRAKEAKSLAGRLSNPAFVEKAKPEAVEKARADHAHHATEAERLEAALTRLELTGPSIAVGDTSPRKQGGGAAGGGHAGGRRGPFATDAKTTFLQPPVCGFNFWMTPDPPRDPHRPSASRRAPEATLAQAEVTRFDLRVARQARSASSTMASANIGTIRCR